ncbi:major facilitator superfamily transporter [Campylobacter lari]|uniref:Putative cyanate transporter CynX n=1 Tax=Campylobacter lari NCTC 11845 TaxID=1388749 RepID=A0A0A8HWF4_CAMLA|nr:MFS transporter [Campylobacter lari]AJD02058.1 putative cyanate transporter CynX [Campylobacter lari NCTC 11845]EAK0847792.1 MFS transporter [Campylobacter lari]EAK0979528.1 MFS transporter [Campylobacter lari]EAK9954704.1 MFS transporter [Campylobacter lari]MCR6543101.1 MFS transporter [Campylobacter lari]
MHTQISYKKFFWINILVVITLALNLRAPVTSIGPMIEYIQEYYNINSTLAGMLTTLPLIAFGLISFFVAYFSQIKALFFALILIVFGEFIRSYGGNIGLFSGVFLIGAGIAIANVLLPSFVKEKFVKNTYKIMGLYGSIIGLSSIAGVALSLPLLKIFEVPQAMFFWVVLALIALIFYFPHLKNKRLLRPKKKNINKINLFLNLTAWKVTIVMGLQSFLSYSLFAWLSVMISEKGFGIDFGSNVLLLSQIIGMPVAFLLPIVLGKLRVRAKSFVIIILGFLYVLSFVLVFFCDVKLALLLAAIFLGFASSGVFTISLLFIAIKSSNSFIAAKLSAMSQGIGYLIAAQAPWIIGMLHDSFGNFTLGFIMLMVVAIILNIFVFLAYKAPVIK